MAATVLNIDYLNEKNDLAKIYFADISTYANNITITTPTIEITAPGFAKMALDFVPNSVNIYTAANLNIDCDATSTLPDGIYTVRYTISPSTKYYIEKTFIRITALKCKWAKAVLTVDLDCACGESKQNQLKLQLRDIKELIEGAVASSNDCDTQGAYDKYTLANKLLDRLKYCDC